MTHATKPDPSAGPASPPRMTYEEFLAWCDEDTHAEWVNGEVVRMSPISEEHQDLGRFLLVLLTLFLEAHPLGRLQYEPFQMKTAPDLPGRAPDILFVTTENLTRLHRTYLEGPADLVVEVVSPDDPDRDREEKFGEYQQGGVREYWLMDQPVRQAAFYQLENGLYRLMPVSEDGIFRSGVLPGFWLKVGWLWQEPRPPVLTILREWGLI
jgi:Uma2 family endonuclease